MIDPPAARNRAHRLAGAAILLLNKFRHDIRGYRTPRAFPVTAIDRAIEYDEAVVRRWTSALEGYLGGPAPLEGKVVLELGPGADLGVGLILLSRGVARYHAVDIHDLASRAPWDLYETLLGRLGDDGSLRREIELARAGRGGRLELMHSPGFDLSALEGKGIDLVFSNAALEHFDDLPDVASRLARVLPAGAVMISLVDLQTHTRWIRDADPLNIYRYSDRFYDALRFVGSPNRLRPREYRRIFEERGWRDVRAVPVSVLREGYVDTVRGGLIERFQGADSQMHILSFLLCARS